MEVDYCLPRSEIAPLLVKLVNSTEKAAKSSEENEKESDEMGGETRPRYRRDAVSFVCPECQGPLYEIKQGEVTNYTCQVGHSFSPEHLSTAHSEALERALWIAVRTLNERVAIHEALAAQQEEQKNKTLARRLAETASSAASDVKLLHEILNRL